MFSKDRLGEVPSCFRNASPNVLLGTGRERLQTELSKKRKIEIKFDIARSEIMITPVHLLLSCLKELSEEKIFSQGK